MPWNAFHLVFLSFVAPAFQARPHSLAAQHVLGRSRLRHARTHRHPHAQTRTSVLGPLSASLLPFFLSKPQCTPRAPQGSFRTLLEAPFGTTLSETWPPLSTTYSITAQSWIQDAAPPNPREDPGSPLQNDTRDLAWPGAAPPHQAFHTWLLSIISSLLLFALHVSPFFLLIINTYLQTSRVA